MAHAILGTLSPDGGQGYVLDTSTDTQDLGTLQNAGSKVTVASQYSFICITLDASLLLLLLNTIMNTVFTISYYCFLYY